MATDARLQVVISAVDQASATLGMIGARIGSFQKSMGDLGNRISRTGQQMSLNLTLPMLAAQRALGAFEGVAKREAASAALEAMAAKVGLSGQAIVDALKNASKGTVDNLALMTGAADLMVKGLAPSMEGLNSLMTLARKRAQEMGISTSQAWDMVTQAVKTGTSQSLKGLGIFIDMEKAIRDYAFSLSKLPEQLTQAERAEAAWRAVLKFSIEDIKGFNAELVTNSEKLQQAGAATRDLSADIMEKLLPAVAAIVDKFNQLPPGVQQGIMVFGLLALVLGPVAQLLGAIVAIAPAVLAFLASPPGLIVVGLGLVAVAIWDIWRNWNTAWPALKEGFNAFKVLIVEVGKVILSSLFLPFNAVVLVVLETIKDVVKLLSYIPGIGPVFRSAMEAIEREQAEWQKVLPWKVGEPGAFEEARNVLKGLLMQTSPGVEKFQAGGIVSRPTLALLGEAGPEAVIPLSRRGPLGPIQPTVNIILEGPVILDNERSADRFAQKVAELLRSRQRLGFITR